MDKIEKVIEMHRDIEDSLSSTVKISHHEVDRLVVNELISKRNFAYDRNKNDDCIFHFDTIIKYYLTEDEFKKYVIDREQVG